jgi:hypothetical protein
VLWCFKVHGPWAKQRQKCKSTILAFSKEI